MALFASTETIPMTTATIIATEPGLKKSVSILSVFNQLCCKCIYCRFQVTVLSAGVLFYRSQDDGWICRQSVGLVVGFLMYPGLILGPSMCKFCSASPSSQNCLPLSEIFRHPTQLSFGHSKNDGFAKCLLYLQAHRICTVCGIESAVIYLLLTIMVKAVMQYFFFWFRSNAFMYMQAHD